MNSNAVRAITSAFHSAKWVDRPLSGIPFRGWFLLELSPLSPYEELPNVLADIHYDRSLRVLGNGQICHNAECRDTHDIPHELVEVQKAIHSLKPRIFKVALHPGIRGVFQGQPLAIALDPVINYERCPDHPHLNVGLQYSPSWYIPDSFCYTDDIPALGEDPVIRMQNAIMYISIWLLRHMLWEQTKKYQQKGTWIGPEAAPLKPSDYVHLINPDGLCRCGKRQSYKACHMPADIESLRSQFLPVLTHSDRKGLIGLIDYSALWQQQRKKPQDHSYTLLNQILSATQS